MHEEFYGICAEVDAFYGDSLDDARGDFAAVVEAVAGRRGVAIPA